MSSTREQIKAAASTYGWEVSGESGVVLIMEKRVPMIEQRDENRVYVVFDVDDTKVMEAFYGPDRRPHKIRPAAAAVIAHLVQVGAEVRR